MRKNIHTGQVASERHRFAPKGFEGIPRPPLGSRRPREHVPKVTDRALAASRVPRGSRILSFQGVVTKET